VREHYGSAPHISDQFVLGLPPAGSPPRPDRVLGLERVVPDEGVVAVARVNA